MGFVLLPMALPISYNFDVGEVVDSSDHNENNSDISRGNMDSAVRLTGYLDFRHQPIVRVL